MFSVARDGEVLGEFSEKDFRAKIFGNEIWPTDSFWRSGMDDWQPVSSYRAAEPTVRNDKGSPPKPLERLVPTISRRPFFQQSTPASIGAFCAVIAALGPLFSPAMIAIAIPLLIAAFILAVMTMVKGRIWIGIALLIGTFIAGPTSCIMLVDREKILSGETRRDLQHEARDHLR